MILLLPTVGLYILVSDGNQKLAQFKYYALCYDYFQLGDLSFLVDRLFEFSSFFIPVAQTALLLNQSLKLSSFK